MDELQADIDMLEANKLRISLPRNFDVEEFGIIMNYRRIRGTFKQRS